jgi:hypothetical protein
MGPVKQFCCLVGGRIAADPVARIVLGATVFVIGVLTGAGVAAWMTPPI